MKKLIFVIIMMISVLLMTGCETMQVNERMFVQMMGIEEDDGIYQLTLQVYSTSGEIESPVPEYEVMTGYGRSIREAVDMISQDTGRDIYLGHCMFIVADEDVLRDGDKLKMLAGEQISIGSKVYISDDPSSCVEVYDNNKLVGADKLAASANRYEYDGLCCSTTLKDVTSAAITGKTAVIPVIDREVIGTAIIDMSGETSVLTLNETAVLNLLNGKKGIRLNVSGADIYTEITDISSYYQQGSGYDIFINAKCVIDETGAPDDLTFYRNETEKIIEDTVSHIYKRAYSEGFAEIIEKNDNSEIYLLDSDSISVCADVIFTVK